MNIKKGNKVKVKFVKDRPGHDLRYALNNNKISKKLKWKTKLSFETGLRKTINWYLENKFFLKKLSTKNYSKRLGLKI